MPSGRLTKCTPELIAEAKRYVDGGYEKHGHVIPSIVGMADVLKVGRSTLHEWAHDETKGFGPILERCNQRQELVLINGGLSGVMNSAIVKLVLGKHGYHERKEHSGPDGKQITSVVFEYRARDKDSNGKTVVCKPGK